MKIKKFIARLYDLPNAFRVLDIMDVAGCDIEKTKWPDCYKIIPKWYVTEEEANDLKKIVLYHNQYKKRNRLAEVLAETVLFRYFRKGSRILQDWI